MDFETLEWGKHLGYSYTIYGKQNIYFADFYVGKQLKTRFITSYYSTLEDAGHAVCDMIEVADVFMSGDL